MSTDTSEHKNQPTWALHLALYAVLLAVIGFLVLRPGSGASAQEDPARNHVAARLDGVAIGYDEAIERAATQLDQLEQQRIQCDLQVASERHGLIERTLEGMVRERLIEASAAIAGLEAGDWRAAEMERLEAGVTDEDVDAFFVENEGRIRGEREELEPQVRTYLAQERFVDALEDGHEIEYLLEPYRLDVDPAAGPVRGAAAAPVTIVEWSDFECPYCKSVLPTLERIPGGVPGAGTARVPPLPAARDPSERAQAAAEAGRVRPGPRRFLGTARPDVRRAGHPDRRRPEGQGGAGPALDAEAFTTCLEREGIGDRVDADRRAGIEVGVNGTPALFVNGRPLAGAVAYEQLAEVVEDELERAGG